MRLSILLIAPLLLVGGLTFSAAHAADHDQQVAMQALRAVVPHVQVAIDERSGVARHVASPDGFLTGPAGVGKGVARAAIAGENQALRGFLTAWPALFGGGADILDDAEIIRDDITQHSGLHTRVWRQMLDGIPIHRGVLVARTTARQELVSVSSDFVPHLPQAAAKVANRAALVAAPAHDAAAAVVIALRSNKLPTDGIITLSAAAGPTKAQRLQASSVSGEIGAHLAWFAGDNGLRLAWSLLLVERPTGVMYAVVVDATSLVLLDRIRLTSHGFADPARIAAARAKDARAAPAGAAQVNDAPPASQAKGGVPTSSAVTPVALRVYTSDSPAPMSPGLSAPGLTQGTEVPRQLVTPTISGTISPNGWIDTTQTLGNNVEAHLDLNFNNSPDLPRPQGSGTSPVTFDFPLDLTQAPSTYRDAAVTNLFYWCNIAHDRLYQLGFTESAGNFQTNNFGRGGSGNDAVQADAQDGSDTDNADFSTPPDGSGFSPRMQMYVFTVGPSPDRDSSLDATVILHEYVHGLTHRLIGGGVFGNLEAVQSSGMGEGWSDFYALALLSEPTDDPLGTYTTGGYLMRNYYNGIRRYPYAVEPGALVTSSSLNPLTFNDLLTSSPSVHDMGEVWCQTLWECRGELIAKHGATAGNTLMLQLVTDGLKLTPANPSYTQARDAILQADFVTGGVNATELWRAFTKRGLGRGASAGSSYSVDEVAESFENSPVFRVSNAVGLRAKGPSGFLPYPVNATFQVNNPGSSSLNWTATRNHTWSTVSPSAGTLSAGASTSVTCTLNSGAAALTDGTWRDTITFTDTTHGLTVVRPVTVVIGANYALSPTPMSWIDPSAHTNLSLLDDTFVGQTLPFTIPFYGNTTSSLFISSNGVIGFASSTGLSTPNNHALPDSATPNNLAAGLWMDLNPQEGGSVRFGIAGDAPTRKAVITWSGVPPFNVPSLPMTFQIVLEEATGDLVMQYLQVQTSNSTYGAGGIAVVGVENSTGTVAMQLSAYGSPLLANNQAFRYQWGGANASPANAAPTVATPAAAGALNGAGTTRPVSVLGADSDGGGEANLNYTWSLAGSPTSLVSIAGNGTNGAKNSTATFTAAGTFPLRVTITDAGGKSVTSSVTTTVPQQLTTLSVSPATATLANGTTLDFNVTGADQFGAPITAAPTVTWTQLSGPGSINGSTGIYTADGQGSATIRAANGGITATATITITNGPPTVATPAAASPNPVTGTTTALSVLGADDMLAADLTYTWNTTGTPPAAVTFSPNGSNAAKNCTATFTKAGSYTLRATITDLQAGTVTSDVVVTVQQTSAAPTLAINPSTLTIAASATQLFTAHDADQFGAPIVATTRTVTWSTVGGSIAADGTFTASSSPGAATITATSVPPGQTATALVTITAGGGGGGDGGGGGGGGCGLGATSALAFMLLLVTWRRRRLGD